jgi:hypothetical protein
MKPKIFKTSVSKERFDLVMRELKFHLDSWHPEVTNMKALYLQNGSKWECTPIQNAVNLSKEESWVGMPKAAIDYLKSLPEFNAKIFEEITGIK